MKIVWFGHSCFRLEIGSSIILIDPFLKGNPAATVKPEELTRDIEALLAR